MRTERKSLSSSLCAAGLSGAAVLFRRTERRDHLATKRRRSMLASPVPARPSPSPRPVLAPSPCAKPPSPHRGTNSRRTPRAAQLASFSGLCGAEQRSGSKLAAAEPVCRAPVLAAAAAPPLPPPPPPPREGQQQEQANRRTDGMKFFFNLLKPKDKEPPYDPAPLTNQAVSALFVGGVAVLVALYSTTTLRCSTQQNQVGCQTMNSVKDCDNLLLASCTTQCGGNPYYFCDGAISQHKQVSWSGSSFTGGWDTAQVTNGFPTSSSSVCPNSASTCADSDVSWRLGNTVPAPPTDAATCKAYYSTLDSSIATGGDLGSSYSYLTCSQRYDAGWRILHLRMRLLTGLRSVLRLAL